VERIRHENEVGGSRRKPCELVGVTLCELAIGNAAFAETMARHLQQTRVDVDGDDVAGDLGDLQREPAVARAKIDHVHSGLDAHCGKHAGGIWPQRLPPSGGRHLGALEESGTIHDGDASTPVAATDGSNEIVWSRFCPAKGFRRIRRPGHG